MSTGPPPRSSASADGSIAYPRNEHHGHPLYEEGPVVKCCAVVCADDGSPGWTTLVVGDGTDGGDGWVRLVSGDHRLVPAAAGPLAGWCSSLYGFLGGRIRSDRSVRLAHLIRGPSRGQRVCVGPCRAERGLGGEHVPDRFGELAGDLAAGDLGAALVAEPGLDALVVAVVGGVTGGVAGVTGGVGGGFQ